VKRKQSADLRRTENATLRLYWTIRGVSEDEAARINYSKKEEPFVLLRSPPRPLVQRNHPGTLKNLKTTTTGMREKSMFLRAV